MRERNEMFNATLPVSVMASDTFGGIDSHVMDMPDVPSQPVSVSDITGATESDCMELLVGEMLFGAAARNDAPRKGETKAGFIFVAGGSMGPEGCETKDWKWCIVCVFVVFDDELRGWISSVRRDILRFISFHV